MPTGTFYPAASADDAFFFYPSTLDDGGNYAGFGNDLDKDDKQI